MGEDYTAEIALKINGGMFTCEMTVALTQTFHARDSLNTINK